MPMLSVSPVDGPLAPVKPVHGRELYGKSEEQSHEIDQDAKFKPHNKINFWESTTVSAYI